jgi:hypothetical protein
MLFATLREDTLKFRSCSKGPLTYHHHKNKVITFVWSVN